MFGDIVLFDVPFTSGASSKARPALVLFDLPLDFVICRVTSVAPAGPADVTLNDWRGAGLLKPSVARLGRPVTLERAVVLRQMGVLSPHDLSAIRSVWNRHMWL